MHTFTRGIFWGCLFQEAVTLLLGGIQFFHCLLYDWSFFQLSLFTMTPPHVCQSNRLLSLSVVKLFFKISRCVMVIEIWEKIVKKLMSQKKKKKTDVSIYWLIDICSTHMAFLWDSLHKIISFSIHTTALNRDWNFLGRVHMTKFGLLKSFNSLKFLECLKYQFAICKWVDLHLLSGLNDGLHTLPPPNLNWIRLYSPYKMIQATCSDPKLL